LIYLFSSPFNFKNKKPTTSNAGLQSKQYFEESPNQLQLAQKPCAVHRPNVVALFDVKGLVRIDEHNLKNVSF
jgi:hypothetical protein